MTTTRWRKDAALVERCGDAVQTRYAGRLKRLYDRGNFAALSSARVGRALTPARRAAAMKMVAAMAATFSSDWRWVYFKEDTKCKRPQWF
jgi:hypothetical protein